MLFYIVLLLSLLIEIDGMSSPVPTYTNYTYSTEIQSNQIDLWWTIDRGQKEVLFELHMKTTGWIALGISPGKNIRIPVDFNVFFSFLIKIQQVE